MHETALSLDEPLLFLSAMEQDLSTDRYSTYEELRGYMRGSAAAVGVMSCALLGLDPDAARSEAAMALGEAMQLTNFLRDIGEDAGRGRIYLPQEDRARFGVRETDILTGRATPEFRALMRFEIARARQLYAASDLAIAGIPGRGGRAVRLARVLYARILDRIEALEYDVFHARARTSRMEKLIALVKVMAGG
jgi:phytoene synthase